MDYARAGCCGSLCGAESEKYRQCRVCDNAICISGETVAIKRKQQKKEGLK